MTDLLTRNTDRLRELVEYHVQHDKVAQQVYWDTEAQRGCFIGCLNHSASPMSAQHEYGLPIMVQRIAESIFEALPPKEATEFFAALPDAVGCDGKDLSRVGWRFLAAALRSMPQQPQQIQAVIDPVIAGMDCLAEGVPWAAASTPDMAADLAATAATDAAHAAYAAAADAAEAAADAAAAARADAAADVAEAAADAADAAAAAAAAASSRHDAITQQARLLLRLIGEAPIVTQIQ